eukprot:58427-Pleurochrysis_carterae.AAC.3
MQAVESAVSMQPSPSAGEVTNRAKRAKNHPLCAANPVGCPRACLPPDVGNQCRVLIPSPRRLTLPLARRARARAWRCPIPWRE